MGMQRNRKPDDAGLLARAVSRRRFLVGGAALSGVAMFTAVGAACGAHTESTPSTIRLRDGGVLETETPIPEPTIPPTATPNATGPGALTGDPETGMTPGILAEATAAFASEEVGQGETALLTVRQPGASGASVRFLGRHYPLMGEGDGEFWAVLGVSLATSLGAQTAEVTTRGPQGEVLSEVSAPFRVVPVERPVDYLVTTAAVAAVLTADASRTESYLRTFEQFNLFEARPRWAGTLLVPAEGRMTTEFGEGRSINGGPVTGMHSGTDIANASGTPILAAAGGRVAWAGWMPIRGNSVLLDHGAGVVTGYHHLLGEHVATGAVVEAGDPIASMGSTGFSTGPHLHWEMTIYGVNVDPMTWTERAFLPEGMGETV